MNISQSSETVILASISQNRTLDIGSSLCASLYPAPVQAPFDASTKLSASSTQGKRCGAGKTNTTIWLRGELGSGKTTFTRGLGFGLGLGEKITSPTYALENRYGDKLLHLDLFRLEPEEAKRVLEASEEFPGIRVVEWSERVGLGLGLGLGIAVEFEEVSENERKLKITFNDITWPDRSTIETWREEVHLPEHIVKHCDAVAAYAKTLAEELLRRGTVARPEAVRVAGELHDLLRFIDFHPKAGPPVVETPDPQLTSTNHNRMRMAATAGRASRQQTTNIAQTIWQQLTNRYPFPHEEACTRFVEEQGYPELGEIIRPHGLRSLDEKGALATTEQKLLFYADKRIMVDKVVTLDERFDDFIERYGKGVESEEAKRWRRMTKELERELFGRETP